MGYRRRPNRFSIWLPLILICAGLYSLQSIPSLAGALPPELAENETFKASKNPVRTDRKPGLAVAIAQAGENQCAVRLGELTVATLDNVPIVTLMANGVPLTLVLDTGAERTVLTPSAAQRVRAEPPRIEFAKPLHGINGTVATREVELKSFTAGDVTIPWRRALVAPIAITPALSSMVDGLLGADVLSSFSVDLDMAYHRMGFYSRFSCPPVWAARYRSISSSLSRGEHLSFPVELDGHLIAALIDTGSQKTALTTRTALALGLTTSALAQDKSPTIRGVTGEPLESHIHAFLKLKIGDEINDNPQILVASMNLSDADLVLGMDYIYSHRIWLSYNSFLVIISPKLN